MHPPREDYPGATWLITNRGIAKRAVFETRQDVERFHEALGAVVELGLVEVHAFVFMTTHLHLLLTSRRGELSYAMQITMNPFVRQWNRTRRRDGPLFARRFHGRKVEDAAHWLAALRYVDLNPVRAGLCGVASDHPWGSARAYRYGVGPVWLSRRRVIATFEDVCSPRSFSPEAYDAFVGAVDADANAYLVERAARHPDRLAPPLCDLIRTAGLRQQRWMEWKAALADGMRVGTAFLSPAEARRTARLVSRTLRRSPLPVGRHTVERDLAAGLLRCAAGRSVTEVATDLGVARSTALAATRRHETWMATSPRYAVLVERALQSAVRRTFGPPRHASSLLPRVDSGALP